MLINNIGLFRTAGKTIWHMAKNMGSHNPNKLFSTTLANVDEFLGSKTFRAMAAPKQPKPITYRPPMPPAMTREQAHYDFYRRNPQLGPAPAYKGKPSMDDYYTISSMPKRRPEPARRFYDFG